MIFNEIIPQDLGFIDRSDPDNICEYEIAKAMKKNDLEVIIERCIKIHGITETAVMLDNLKAIGFKYSTRGSISIGISDMLVPKVKQEYLDKTEIKIEEIRNMFDDGLISEEERHEATIKEWTNTVDNVTTALKANLGETNPIFMMSDSGARGNINQIRQLAGMRGLMANTSGETLEMPIKSNFREGLNVLEFFISTHGTRKGLADTALRTADSGYLTRRLVEVSQDVIIREDDCGTDKYFSIADIIENDKVIVSMQSRITGRFSAENVKDPETGTVLIKKNNLITDDIAAKIEAAGITNVKVRTVLTCQSRHGICSKCYGNNLATRAPISIGEAVGIIAAQSIGEPGTQLTMRTFHTGGVAGDDITQGLPRVEEIFEARKPKGLAIVSEIAGEVSIIEDHNKRDILVTTPLAKGKKAKDVELESVTYSIPYGSRIKVREGDMIEAGDVLTEGSVNPSDILKIKGLEALQEYLLHEVQKVYVLQGVSINDKHIEVIARQMLRKVRVEEANDADVLPGELKDIFEFDAENERVKELGLTPATASRVLLGITKATLATDSFLSAASFQETTRVLTDASIKGKIDSLFGLKENVIIGKLIPAGTGMGIYRNIDVCAVGGSSLKTAVEAAEEARATEAYAEPGVSVNDVIIDIPQK
jgi:DNA-directed RNA polymerase subunit beta'